jgi:hypothetical protein
MCRYVISMRRLSLNLVLVRRFLTELSFLNLQKDMKFSVFVHYLCSGYTKFKFDVWIRHKIMQVKIRIWSWFDDILKRNFQFPLSNFCLDVYVCIRLKYVI